MGRVESHGDQRPWKLQVLLGVDGIPGRVATGLQHRVQLHWERAVRVDHHQRDSLESPCVRAGGVWTSAVHVAADVHAMRAQPVVESRGFVFGIVLSVVWGDGECHR